MAVLAPVMFRQLIRERDLPPEEEPVFELVNVAGKPLEGGIDIEADGVPEDWAEVLD